MNCPTQRCDGAEDLAGELGAASRALAEAIALLPKCIGALDRQLQLKRIESLRQLRDNAAERYRAAVSGGTAC